jgi:hypothetical protein
MTRELNNKSARSDLRSSSDRYIHFGANAERNRMSTNKVEVPGALQ